MGLTTDAFNGIWAALKSDAAMSALLRGGTLFPFTGEGLKKKLEIMPAICPVFAMSPAPTGNAWPPAKRRQGPDQEPRAAFQLEMATAGEDSRKIVELTDGFQAFMTRAFASDRFGVAMLVDAEYSNLAYVPKLQLDQNIELWQFNGLMICRFRIV